MGMLVLQNLHLLKTPLKAIYIFSLFECLFRLPGLHFLIKSKIGNVVKKYYNLK